MELQTDDRNETQKVDRVQTKLNNVSRIQLLTVKISHICQDIRDIKNVRKPKSNSLLGNYTSTHLDEGQTNQKSTWELHNNSSAKEGSDDEDGSGDTYSSCSTQYHHEPSVMA